MEPIEPMLMASLRWVIIIHIFLWRSQNVVGQAVTSHCKLNKEYTVESKINLPLVNKQDNNGVSLE